MTDAYRTSAFLCPVCANVALREFSGRLVCDECQGMQLSADDFAESIREIDGSKDQLTISDQTKAGKACPQCSQPMTTCSLTFGSLVVADGRLMRCASHGVWIPRDTMTAAYARASRRGGFRGLGATASTAAQRSGVRSGTDAASVISNMPSGHSGMSGAMASIAKAFGAGPASGGLAISNWQRVRPRAHTLFVSAHKGLPLDCPACKSPLSYQGDRWACTPCSGLFVENDALVAMVREMALAPWELPKSTGKPGDRGCPICHTPMIVEVLEGATIDRCDVHGVWFDEHELGQALHHASAPGHGLVAWLKRLFR
ncbi:MAG TPA: zf-TFIIB domain-containing protein [Kofleriaceae bacterium]